MRLALGVFLIGLSVAASQTRVFTDGADIVAAVALSSFVFLAATRSAVGVPRRTLSSSVAVPSDVLLRSIVIWAGLATITLGFELFEYAESPRQSHPTLSSALTVLATHSWSRGVAFFAWLALGAWIARR